MTKNLDTISEAIINPKHEFPKSHSQPNKRNQHRYVRRKVKELLHWTKADLEAEPSVAL